MIRGLAVRVSNQRELAHVIYTCEQDSKYAKWESLSNIVPILKNSKCFIVYDDEDCDSFMYNWKEQAPTQLIIAYAEFVSKYARPQLNLYL